MVKATKYAAELEATAQALCAPGKGLLASDESTGTIGKRLADVGLENTLENRTAYRALLFATPDLASAISGAILFEETLNDDSLRDALLAAGVVPGIKLDKGVKPLADGGVETGTAHGLEGLPARVAAAYARGARFAKWRAVLRVDPGQGWPSAASLDASADALARYALDCTQGGLVPVVEPELLMDGAHSLADCEAATTTILGAVFGALHRHGVDMRQIVLKPNFVHEGSSFAGTPSTPADVAAATLRALNATVPPAVAGVLFLSGGLTELEATAVLDACNKAGGSPWALTFSYGRALQKSCLQAWKGDVANVEAAQKVFARRFYLNSKAAVGSYDGEDMA